jgi:hypothetical protein
MVVTRRVVEKIMEREWTVRRTRTYTEILITHIESTALEEGNLFYLFRIIPFSELINSINLY